MFDARIFVWIMRGWASACDFLDRGEGFDWENVWRKEMEFVEKT